MAQRPDDWLVVPLCSDPSGLGIRMGCHNEQHLIGEQTFWKRYEKSHGQTVEQLLDELCKASPKRAEIERVKRERDV